MFSGTTTFLIFSYHYLSFISITCSSCHGMHLCACTVRMCDFGQPGNPVRSLAAFVVPAEMRVL